MGVRYSIIKAVLDEFINMNNDFMLYVAKDICQLPSSCQHHEIIKLNNNDATIEQVKITAIRYRTNFNNSPMCEKDGISCMLSFGGKMSATFVPYSAIVGIKDEHSEFGFNIPILADNISELIGMQPQLEIAPVEDKPKVVKPKRDRSFLSVVK